MLTSFFIFFWSRKPWVQVYVRVRDETQEQKMKKLVNIDINDVYDEAYAARHSFSNKAPVNFIFWEPLIINDDQWLLKYEGHRRFIR